MKVLFRGYLWTLLLLMTRMDAVLPAPVNSDAQAMTYLARFGYLNPSQQNRSSGALLSAEALKRAAMEFQAFAGIKQTGVFDAETLKWMSKPRCGVKDKIDTSNTTRRAKRFALEGSRWRGKQLTYAISKYPAGLGQSDVDRELTRAFQLWADVSELSFTHDRSGKAQIEIRFEIGQHGDGDPFDGSGGTLAHAYFPIYGGDAHFDDAETWTINSARGIDLFQVAAHEFGHSLGLSHSDVNSALMAPFYRGFQPNFKLDSDDIKAIQAIYGKIAAGSGGGVTQPVSPPKDTPGPGATASNGNDLCADGRIDTIFTVPDGSTFVFKGDKYWKLEGETVAAGYPQAIASKWPGLPANVDAAFSWDKGRTYFFKGSKYWRFTNQKADSGYPKELSEGFAGVPSDVDAAFVWSNNKIYFFKGSKYWRFDPDLKPPIRPTYPMDISSWGGLPNDMDAAFRSTNGFTYFFKDGLYWRFNDRSFKVEVSDPPFPRSTGKWWFGCDRQVKGLTTPRTAIPMETRNPNNSGKAGSKNKNKKQKQNKSQKKNATKQTKKPASE